VVGLLGNLARGEKSGGHNGLTGVKRGLLGEGKGGGI